MLIVTRSARAAVLGVAVVEIIVFAVLEHSSDHFASAQ